MPQRPKNSLTVLCALFCVACTETTTNTSIHVTAKRPDGSAVPLATVQIDGEIVGETNAFGTLQLSKNLNTKGDHIISVSVDDPTYYYSPHSEKFRADSRRDNRIDISAVMYLVPKPKNLMTQKLKHSPVPLEQTKTISSELQASGASLAETALPLIDLNLGHFDSPEEPLPEKVTAITDQAIFNVHVYSGHAPISNAKVTWASHSSQVSTCMTNDRGRCALWKDKKLVGSGTILVQKKGFESSLKEILPDENQNIRFNLKSGSTVDLRVFSAHPNADDPADGVSIVVGRDMVTKSNKSGFIIFPASQHDPKILTLKYQGLEIPVVIPSTTADEEITVLRLPNNSDSFKPNYVIYNVHTPKIQDISISAEALENIIDAIKNETTASRTVLLTARPDQLKLGDIGILPVLENTGKGMKRSISLLDKDLGTVISEQADGIELSTDGIAIAVKRLLTDLNARQSAYGVVIGTDRNALVIAMDAKKTTPGDKVTVETRDQSFVGSVTKIINNKVHVISSEISLPTDAWRLLGARTVTQPKQPASITEFQEFLPSLTPRSPDLLSIDTALKHLTENNPQQALKSLESLNDRSPVHTILRNHQAAQAHLLLGDTSRAVACLYSAISAAVEHDLKVPAFLSAVNLNRLKAELLPDISSDRSLADALQEIKTENQYLLSQIDIIRSDLGPIKATLDYTRILISQKLAKATADNAALSKIPDSWNELEKSLSAQKLSTMQLQGLKQSIAKSRRLVLGPEKVQL